MQQQMFERLKVNVKGSLFIHSFIHSQLIIDVRLKRISEIKVEIRNDIYLDIVSVRAYEYASNTEIKNIAHITII